MRKLAVLLIAFALRVYHLETQSIWWDEGHSIQMASAPLRQIPTLPGMDVHPPGYFALLHQWMALLGDSEFALRYLSVIFSLLTVALLMRFGRVLADGSDGRPMLMVGVGALAALSPLYVAYAQEVRMYAMVTFFALASIYFQWRIIGWMVGWLDGWTVGWSFLGYVTATATSLYTHYFTVFLLVFQNIAWLAWALLSKGRAGGRRGRIAVWLGGQVAILILFLPQLRLALRQTVAYANPNLNPPGLAEFVSRVWLAYILGPSVDPALAGWVGWVVAVIIGMVILVRGVRAWRGAQTGLLIRLAFLAGWFLVPLAAYFVVLQRRPSFEPRYMILVTPALMLLADLAGNRNGGLRQPLWSRLGFLVILAAFVWGTWSYFTRVEAYKDDSAGVAAWLAHETAPDDLVYVDVPHPFHYYADHVPAPVRYLFVDVHTAAEVLNNEAPGRDRLFWVTWWASDTDPRGIIPFLLDKAAFRSGELDFRGYHITWWTLPDNVHFSLPNDLSPIDITFGDVIRLDGMAFADKAQVGGSAWATLHFDLMRDTDVDYRVSLRLRRPDEAMLPPVDKNLLNDRHFRTSAWPPDDYRLNQAINVYTVAIPSEAKPGDYCLEAVVYDANTLEALPVLGVAALGCNSGSEDSISAPLGRVAIFK